MCRQCVLFLRTVPTGPIVVATYSLEPTLQHEMKRNLCNDWLQVSAGPRCLMGWMAPETISKGCVPDLHTTPATSSSVQLIHNKDKSIAAVCIDYISRSTRCLPMPAAPCTEAHTNTDQQALVTLGVRIQL